MGLVKLWHIHSHNGDVLSLVYKEGTDKMEYIDIAVGFFPVNVRSMELHRKLATWVASSLGKKMGSRI